MLDGEARRWMSEHGQKVVEEMGSKQAQANRDFFQKLLATLSPQQRIAGLRPEQVLGAFAPQERVAGLAPEQVLGAFAPEERVAGLAPEQLGAALGDHAVLALPDELLRALAPEAIATLPEDVQARIATRLAKKPARPAAARPRQKRKR